VLTHYRARRRLGAYLDGALEQADARRVERHLTACSACQDEVAQLRRLKSLIAEASAVPEPDWTGFFPGIVRGIEDERRAATTAVRRAPARRWWRQWAMGGAALASVALAVVLWQGARVPAEAAVLVTDANTENPAATVMVYSAPEKDLAVVWVFDSEAQ
jgi:anti-sigma factor RsiW